MKFTNLLKKLASTTALVATASTVLVASHAAAIPYTGPDTPPSPVPAFNIYTGVPSIGNEADFFRGKVSGSTGYIDPVNDNCADGTQFDLRVYVHNAASQYENGDGNGPSVAHNSKVSVNLNNSGQKASFAMSSTISSSNATSITDGLTINCNGNLVSLSFIPGSAQQYTVPGGTQALSDSIVTPAGAPIGTVRPDGNVWGCWDQRVWIGLKVQVKKVTPPPVVSTGECKVLDVVSSDNRKVHAKVNANVNNATVVGYKIDWGDGTTSDKQEDNHTYAKDGTYKIVASVNIKFADGHTEWKSASACTQEVKFESGQPQPPQPPLSVIPDTGAGSVAAIFTAVSVAGAAAYRVFMTRRLSE